MGKEIDDLKKKAVTKYELQRMMDSTEDKMEVIMDTKMDGLKGDIMEGLKKLCHLKVTMHPMKFMMRKKGR